MRGLIMSRLIWIYALCKSLLLLYVAVKENTARGVRDGWRSFTLFLMNGLKQTESTIFCFWFVLYFQKIPTLEWFINLTRYLLRVFCETYVTTIASVLRGFSSWHSTSAGDSSILSSSNLATEGQEQIPQQEVCVQLTETFAVMKIQNSFFFFKNSRE